jgi:hypothetical protein
MSAEVQPIPAPADVPANDFWTQPRKTLEELAAEQGIKPWTTETIAEMHAVGKQIWPEDDIDEFLAWLRETRRDGIPARESP